MSTHSLLLFSLRALYDQTLGYCSHFQKKTLDKNQKHWNLYIKNVVLHVWKIWAKMPDNILHLD